MMKVAQVNVVIVDNTDEVLEQGGLCRRKAHAIQPRHRRAGKLL
jgi:hypothetical protein